jgi:hypothetical protein
MKIVVTSINLGPNLAGEASGSLYRVWNFLRNRLASTDPNRSSLTTSPYTIVEASSAGTMNVATPNSTENSAVLSVLEELEARMSRLKGKKK